MTTGISIFALLAASMSCALSLAVALRVKRILDPLVEEGQLRPGGSDGVKLGTRVPDMGVLTDVHGESLELPTASGKQWLLTFQSVSCTGCKQQLPRYKKFLQTQKAGPHSVFSIVVGDTAGHDIYASELEGLSRIIHVDEATSRRFTEELGLTGWPTYLVIDGAGQVAYSASSSARLASSGVSLDPSEVTAP